MWYGRNEDETLVKFQYKPWMNAENGKWCFTNDDGTESFGEAAEDTDKTKDLKYEDDAIFIEE